MNVVTTFVTSQEVAATNNLKFLSRGQVRNMALPIVAAAAEAVDTKEASFLISTREIKLKKLPKINWTQIKWNNIDGNVNYIKIK